jgi:hypothetical protein
MRNGLTIHKILWSLRGRIANDHAIDAAVSYYRCDVKELRLVEIWGNF